MRPQHLVMRSWRSGPMRAVSLAAALIVVMTMAPNMAQADEGSRFDETDLLRTRAGAIASVHPLASQAGIVVLEEGGNAIDAAVTVAFALGVVRPEMTGPGGGGFMLYRSADGSEVAALDFRETAPADVTKTFRDGPGIDDFTWLSIYGGAGHRVAGVPGNIAGLAAALERYGTISLARAIDPAASIGEEGFVVSQELQNFMFLGIPYLRLFDETAKVFLHGTAVSYPSEDCLGCSALIDLAPPKTFEFVQPDHAKSLRLIAEEGADAFYRGEIADLIVDDFERSASRDPAYYPTGAAQMTKEDLANYRAIWRKPIRTSYRGHEIIGMPPPASGGVFTAEVLNILEGFNLRSFGHSSADHLHYLNEATKIALADRKKYLADPDSLYDYDGDGVEDQEVPTKTLTSKRYAKQRRGEIQQFATKIYEPGEMLSKTGHPSHTTHLSVIDAEGNAVSMTLSLNGPFGSGVVAEGTGFVLNNHLLDFDTTNVSGDPSNGQTGPVNAPGPGKRPLSAMSPAIVARDGKARLVVGAAGGPLILRGVPQAVINTIDFGMDVGRAIDAERIFPANTRASASFPPDGAVDVMDMEGSRIDEDVRIELKRRGHQLNNEGVEYSTLPILEGVGTDLITGEHLAYSDTRSEHGAAVQSSPP